VCVCVCVCAANIVPFVPRCLKFRWFKTETIWKCVCSYAHMTVLKCIN